MSLSFRIARPADLPRCQALLAPLVPVVYPPDVWEALPDLWTRLRAERRFELHVFEDSARPAAQRIFCLASGVFVAPDFAAELMIAPRRFIAREIYRREMTGDTVILSLAEVARANRDPGVDAIGLDYAVERLRWTDLAGLRLIPLVPESLRLWLGGYRLNSLHRELFEADTKLLVRAAGMRRRRPMRGAREGRGAAGGLRPGLFGLTREEAMAAPGTAGSLFFVHSEPIFDFTRAQQELLRLALLGESDAEVAVSLEISLSTVKKHWQGVFERVAAIGPDWHPKAAPDVVDGTRGIEKRRHLLSYLRHHLEEIRPRA
ncbi:helix-turn-helix transcriptional regulator [Myxococcota bacterium]|nr:helix-turn-helix transcriptional regulator [Myxococcota bacterium]